MQFSNCKNRIKLKEEENTVKALICFKLNFLKTDFHFLLFVHTHKTKPNYLSDYYLHII